MPFVFRNEGDTENPSLAQVYGNQLTESKLLYYTKTNGRTRCICVLGEGEMDGIDKFYFHGDIIPEYAPDGQKIWRVHPGTITKKPIYKRSTSISGNIISFTGAHGFTNGQTVGVVGMTLPGGLEAREYTAVVLSPTTLSLSLNSQTVVLSTTTPQVSMFDPAGVGFNDPIQGRPEFFPEINFTFSGICYIEINMTADMSAFDDDEPTQFKFLVRGKRVQNFDADGNLADAQGVAFPDQENLPVQTKFFSANNALVAVDIALNNMKMKRERIDWPSFVTFRERCDGVIPWETGNTATEGYPSWSVSNHLGTNGSLTNSPLDVLYKSGSSSNWEGDTTTQVNASGPFSISGVYRSGGTAIGIARQPGLGSYTDMYFGLTIRESDNTKIYAWHNGIQLAYLGESLFGDVFKVVVEPLAQGADVKFYHNDTLKLTHNVPDFDYSQGLRGAFAAEAPESRMTNLKISPISGQGTRNAQRYNAHIVFPNEGPASTAFEQCFSRAPGCHWQDVNGKIVFIAYPGITKIDPVSGFETGELITPENYAPGERVLAKDLIFDPKLIFTRSNIVQNSFSYYMKPTDEKINWIRMEYRDLDDQFYTKQYTYLDRPELRDLTGSLVDSGLIPVGVASKSLSDRIGEATLRVGSDLDLFVELRGMPDTYRIAKGDIVRLAHDVPDWTAYDTKLFIVIEEVFDSSINANGTKSFTLQIYRPDFYSDTDHGQIQPFATTPLISTYPPVAKSLSFTQGTEQNGADILYKFNGKIKFDVSFGKKQIARIYYRHETTPPESESVIVVEQTNAATEEQNFTLPGLIPGVYFFRARTESEQGKLSDKDFFHTSLLDPLLYPRRELVNLDITGMEPNGGFLYKNLPDGWNNSYAYSLRRISNDAIVAYLEFTIGLTGGYQIGLANGPVNGQNADFSVEVSSDATSFIVRDEGILKSGSETSCKDGDIVRIKLESGDLNVYHILQGTRDELLISTFSTSKFPLYADARIHDNGASLPKIFMYGNLEDTEGLKLHWVSNKAVILDTNEDLQRQIPNSSWDFPNNAETFSAEYLDSDGHIDFVASETNTTRSVGLAYSDVVVDATHINSVNENEYSIRLRADGTAIVRELNTDLAGSSVPYSEGTIFSIQRLNNNIFYRKDGIIFWDSTISVDTSLDNLYVRTNFFTEGATIKGLRLHRVGRPLTATYFGSALIHQVDTISMYTRIDNGDVFFQMSMFFIDSDYSNVGSITRASIKVKNKFGEEIANFPSFSFTGGGIVGQGYHTRKYADPHFEAIYEVKVAAATGEFSAPVYFKLKNEKGIETNIVLIEPTPLNKNISPQDLTGSAVSDTTVNLQWVYGDNTNPLTVQRYTKQGWVNAGSSVSPYQVTELSALTDYDFRIKVSDNIFSNIFRIKTLQQNVTPSIYTAPSALTAAPSGAFGAVLNWVRNASDNTGVEVQIDNNPAIPLGATEITYPVTNLSEGTHTFKVRNIFAGGNSSYSNEESLTITGQISSPTAPFGLVTSPVSSSSIYLNWQNASSGSVFIEKMDLVTGAWSLYRTLSSGSTTFTDSGLDPNSTHYYRIGSVVQGYSNVSSETTLGEIVWSPGRDFENELCVLWNTEILLPNLETCRADLIQPDQEIISLTKKGISTAKVKALSVGNSTSLCIIGTKKGEILYCTPSHPLVIDFNLNVKNASEFQLNDDLLIFTKHDNCVIMDKVSSIQILRGSFKVIIYEMDSEEHTFISNNIVSHNIEFKPGRVASISL